MGGLAGAIEHSERPGPQGRGHFPLFFPPPSCPFDDDRGRGGLQPPEQLQQSHASFSERAGAFVQRQGQIDDRDVDLMQTDHFRSLPACGNPQRAHADRLQQHRESVCPWVGVPRRGREQQVQPPFTYRCWTGWLGRPDIHAQALAASLMPIGSVPRPGAPDQQANDREASPLSVADGRGRDVPFRQPGKARGAPRPRPAMDPKAGASHHRPGEPAISCQACLGRAERAGNRHPATPAARSCC